MTAVSGSLQDADQQVVENKPDGSAEINAEINNRFGQNVRRRVHQPQDRRREKHAEQGHQPAADQPERCTGMYGTDDLIVFLRAQIAGNQYTAAHGYAREKPDDEKEQV